MAKKLWVSLLLCSFCFVFLLTNQAAAQAVYGSIFGTVTDQTGAAVPNAKVTVSSQRQGTTETATSNDTGNYSVTHLIPGPYDVRIEASGFKTLEYKAVPVSADVSTRADGQFQVGVTESTVEVTAEAPQLKTDRADVATLFSEKQVQELPIYNRNFTSLILGTPGTQQQSWSHASSENPQGSLQTKVNGQTFSGTGFQLDGTENRDPILGIIVINPPLESVTEAKITSQNYDAEFGQAIAGVVTSQTKSGSNSIHGSAFGFRRSDANQARDPFANQKKNSLTGRFLPQTLWGQYGGSLGGPIIKNKLFIFGDYQGTRRKSGASFTQTVPSDLVRSTCLAGLDCNLSQYSQQIFDPTTQTVVPDPNNPGKFIVVATPFPGNIIPAGRLSPQAIAILKAMPPSNINLGSPIVSNYAASGTGVFNDDSFDIRSDFHATERMSVFGRYSFAKFNQSAGGAFDTGGAILGGRGFGDGGFAGQSNVKNQSIAAGFDYTLSSSLLTDFRFGYMKYHVNVVPEGVGTTPASEIGIPGLNLGTDFTSGHPGFFIGSFGDSGQENTGDITKTGALSGIGFGLGINRCNCPLLESENQYQFVNNWTKIRGNHSIKFGGDIRYALNLRVPSDRHRAGELSFAQERTSSAGSGGVSLATFLLGDVTRFTRYASTSTSAAERQKRWFFYGQDTWRATPKLTINYGLRWDIYFPEYVNAAGNGGFVNASTGEVLIAGQNGVGLNGNVNTNYKHFAPRLGIAYQFSPKTVVRAGFGRSYDVGVFGVSFGHNVTQNLPVLASQSLNPAQPYAPVFTLASGPPSATSPGAILAAAPLGPTGNHLLPNGISAKILPLNSDNTMRIPTTDAWNLTIERQLTPTLVVSAAYVGNKEEHVTPGGTNYNTNQPKLNAGLPPTNTNLRRFYFQKFGWSQSVNAYTDDATVKYSGLQLRGEKRFANGFSFQGNYTWASAFDFANDYFFWDRSIDYGRESGVRRHVFNLSHVYELPFGRGHAFFKDASGPVDYLIGGWQLSGVWLWGTGMPFTPSYN